MNDLFYLTQNKNFQTELNQPYYLELRGEAAQTMVTPMKESKAGQRRLRTETINGPVIPAPSKNIVDALVKYEKNPEGLPPLLYATKMGDFEAVKILIEHGADVNQIYSKDCAVRLALQHPSILKLLIDSGADLNVKLASRKTPLHYLVLDRAQLPAATADDNIFEALCILLENGADVNAVDLYGKTPLHHYCKANSRITLALLENGANIHITDDKGWKPLHLAYQEHDIELLKEFIKKGGSLNEFAPNGRNALHFAFYGNAVKSDCLNLVKWLVDEQKMNVNEFSQWGEGKTGAPTPVMFALASMPEEDFELVEFLLSRGADLNIRCHMNGHPTWRGVLDWSKQQAQLPRYIQEWLIQHGAR